MQLRVLQQHIESTYEADVQHNVNDFLITDFQLATALESDHNARAAREKLLVAQDGDAIDLSLYLDPDLLDRLRAEDPLTCLHKGNLGDFCIALEGVSHFVYLVWNAGFDREVTLLELEMQAEIDKYVMSTLFLLHQQRSEFSAELHEHLFEQVSFDVALDAKGLERYRDASRYAAKYCQQLAERFFRGTSGEGLMNELRRFYRLTQSGKIRHIESN